MDDLNRREFLKMSAAVGGGIAVGTAASASKQVQEAAQAVWYGIGQWFSRVDREEFERLWTNIQSAYASCEAFVASMSGFPDMSKLFPHPDFTFVVDLPQRELYLPAIVDLKILKGTIDLIGQTISNDQTHKLTPQSARTIFNQAVMEVTKLSKDKTAKAYPIDAVLNLWNKVGNKFQEPNVRDKDPVDGPPQPRLRRGISDVRRVSPVPVDIVLGEVTADRAAGYNSPLREIHVDREDEILRYYEQATIPEQKQFITTFIVAHELSHAMSLFVRYPRVLQLVHVSTLPRLLSARWEAHARGIKTMVSLDPSLKGNSFQSTVLQCVADKSCIDIDGLPQLLWNDSRKSMFDMGERYFLLPWVGKFSRFLSDEFSEMLLSYLVEERIGRLVDILSRLDPIAGQAVELYRGMIMQGIKYKNPLQAIDAVARRTGFYCMKLVVDGDYTGRLSEGDQEELIRAALQFEEEHYADTVAAYLTMAMGPHVAKPVNADELVAELQKTPEVRYFQAVVDALGREKLSALVGETKRALAARWFTKAPSLAHAIESLPDRPIGI